MRGGREKWRFRIAVCSILKKIQMESKHLVVEEVCSAIGNEELDRARLTIQSKYPFSPQKSAGRKYTEIQKTKIFVRDGFIDRYSGEKLVFPPVLRLISMLMPKEFPFHKNWKMTECHTAYWQLLPTIDHVIPISRGGEDDETNWVCTSQLKNSVKANWLLSELGWKIHKPGNIREWDGLLNWFFSYVAANQSVLNNGYIRLWYRAGEHIIV